MQVLELFVLPVLPLKLTERMFDTSARGEIYQEIFFYLPPPYKKQEYKILIASVKSHVKANKVSCSTYLMIMHYDPHVNP
jgi:hypothetical protein